MTDADWTGDDRRIRRTVTVPADTIDALLAAITYAETELDHHAVVTELGDQLTFELWTHTEDRVTGKDRELARRIDEAIDSNVTDSHVT